MGRFLRPNKHIYFICIRSFLLRPIIPPIPPLISRATSRISVRSDTESPLFVRPVIVIKIKIANPVIKPTTSPADFVILLVISPPEKAPTESSQGYIISKLSWQQTACHYNCGEYASKNYRYKQSADCSEKYSFNQQFFVGQKNTPENNLLNYIRGS